MLRYGLHLSWCWLLLLQTGLHHSQAGLRLFSIGICLGLHLF
jgi:hypothetical protein